MNLKVALNSKKPFIIKTDGTIENVEPQNGEDFKLDELKSIVGGYVQIVYLDVPKGLIMVLNEEGKIYDLPLNTIATKIWKITCEDDYVVGDVLICELSQVK